MDTQGFQDLGGDGTLDMIETMGQDQFLELEGDAMAGAFSAMDHDQMGAMGHDEVFEALDKDNIVKPLVAETGAEVSILSGSSSDQFARLLASPDAPPVDVLFLDLDLAVSGFAQGMFEVLDVATIPNLANVYPASIYGNGQAVAQSFGAITIVYDYKLEVRFLSCLRKRK